MPTFGPYKSARNAEHIRNEDNRDRCREQVQVAATAVDIPAGRVMAKRSDNGQWVPFVVGGATGTGTAAGVLFARCRANAGATTRRVVNVRDTSYFGQKLTWPAGITQAEIDAAAAQLAQSGQIIRY